MHFWSRVHDAGGLGRALAGCRRDIGMSQAELAEWIDVDRTTVVRMESGSLGALERLTAALAVVGAELVVVPRQADVKVTALTPPADVSADPAHSG